MRELRVDGAAVELGARAFDLLHVLAERRERVVGKHELLDLVWPGVVVEENNIAAQISALRKVLGNGAIATIPGRGYRFTAAVESAGTAPPAAVPSDGTRLLRTNLPNELTPLLGRAEDLAALGELINQHRLVSIVGAGGMGKTLLAQHLLALRRDRYRHGVCWVELGTVSDAEALPATIAAALGVKTGGGEPLPGLCGAVAPLDMLLALDNAEQVVEGVAQVCAALRDAAPGLRIVVTTQAPLKLAAERAYRIGALAVPQGPLPAAQALEFGAVALFVERAQAADARFVLSDAMAPAAIELCRQLDGLPLAIELAAARAPMLGVQRLVQSMADRLQVLTRGGNRLAPARQQTLRAALEWSHGLLEERERKVFRRLAVFAGSASLALIQQVVADEAGVGELDEWAVLDALALLVERSLVMALIADDAVEPRYRLLDSPRLFAQALLHEAGERDALRQRHAQAVAGLFDDASTRYFCGGMAADAWRQALVADLDNAREALAWARAADDATMQVQIATTLMRVLTGSAHREQLALADQLDPLVERVDRVDLLARLAGRCTCVFGRTRRPRALAVAQRCLARVPPATASATDNERLARYLCLSALAVALGASRAADLGPAEAALAEASSLEDAAWPAHRRYWRVEAESYVVWARGKTLENLRLVRQLALLEKAIGDSHGIARTNISDAELGCGDAAAAVASGTALVATLEGGRDEHNLAFARANLAAAHLALGQIERARAHLRDGWAQAPLFDMQHIFADYLALLAALEDRPVAAAQLAGRANAVNAKVGPRGPNEVAAIERATRLARAALGDAQFDRLHAEGATLRDADIDALAFASEDAG